MTFVSKRTVPYDIWNAYIDKSVVEKITKLSDKYSDKLFRQADKRMKNEELITTLAYLDYKDKVDNVKPSQIINIFIRNKRINARMKSKSNITTLFDTLIKNEDTSFIGCVENVEKFIRKLLILCESNF